MVLVHDTPDVSKQLVLGHSPLKTRHKTLVLERSSLYLQDRSTLDSEDKETEKNVDRPCQPRCL